METLESITFRVGSRVHCILYGGDDGTIFSISGQQRPDTVEQIPALGGVIGGSAYFDIVFDGGTISRRVPEGIVRGVQWRLIDGFDTTEQIAQRLAFAEDKRRKDEDAARTRSEQAAAERIALPGKYPFLVPLVADGRRSSAQGAANLRRHLKHAFPAVKFSITSSHGAITVRWELGPTTRQVDEIADLYQSSDFDSQQDMSVGRDSVWPEVFGGADYVNCERSMGDAAPVLLKAVCERYGVAPKENAWIEYRGAWASTVAHRIFHRTEIPVGAVVTGIEWPAGQTCGEYAVAFTLPNSTRA